MFGKVAPESQNSNMLDRSADPSKRACMYADTDIIGERASNIGIVAFTSFVFIAVLLIVGMIGWMIAGEISLLVVLFAAVAAILACMACHIAQQWERVVVLRLGKFNRVSGPGMFWTFPFIESNTMRIDTRTRVTNFGAEETLTADLVPLDVNAVLFWHVWDAKAACLEVGDFTTAVELSAQTALRDAIGRASAAEVAIRRDQLDRELKRVLEEKVAPWGVTILSVEVRDILIPKELQDTMSLEAQAEQRKKSRIILMEAEQDIFDIINELKESYADDEDVMRLRIMHLVSEAALGGKGTVVVPSSFSEGFTDIFKDVDVTK